MASPGRSPTGVGRQRSRGHRPTWRPNNSPRGATSIQSDLYSLGLVLYEVFTGRRVYEFSSLAELMRVHEESSVTPPSALTADIDPAVERVILHCLEKEPQDRPKSARAVAAALPGGDPLAAALAAGDTPSPGMVAAAGGVGEIPVAVAGACLAGVAIGLLVVSLLAQRTMLFNRAPLELPPDALEVKAKEIIKRLGYTGPPPYTARGFEDAPADREAIKQAKLPPGVTDRWELLRTGPWPGLRFWYRQSPEPMVVSEFWDELGLYSRTRVDSQLPPWVTPGYGGHEARSPGDAAVVPGRPTGTETGRSVAIAGGKACRCPGQSNRRETADPSDLPWSTWFREEELGFSLEASSEEGRNPRKLSGDELREADWLRTPPDAYDQLAAWKGTWPDSDVPLYVEAATYRGRPVYFEVLPPSFAEAKEASGAPGPATQPGLVICHLFWIFPFARRRIAPGLAEPEAGPRRSSRGSSTRPVHLPHLPAHLGVPSQPRGRAVSNGRIFTIGLAQALLPAVLLWLYYIALEPFVRRLWPETLISWARLLGGRVFGSPRRSGSHLRLPARCPRNNSHQVRPMGPCLVRPAAGSGS